MQIVQNAGTPLQNHPQSSPPVGFLPDLSLPLSRFPNRRRRRLASTAGSGRLDRRRRSQTTCLHALLLPVHLDLDFRRRLAHAHPYSPVRVSVLTVARLLRHAPALSSDRTASCWSHDAAMVVVPAVVASFFHLGDEDGRLPPPAPSRVAQPYPTVPGATVEVLRYVSPSFSSLTSLPSRIHGRLAPSVANRPNTWHNLTVSSYFRSL